MDPGTDYCYAGELLALLRSLTRGVRRVLGERGASGSAQVTHTRC